MTDIVSYLGGFAAGIVMSTLIGQVVDQHGAPQDEPETGQAERNRHRGASRSSARPVRPIKR